MWLAAGEPGKALEWRSRPPTTNPTRPARRCWRSSCCRSSAEAEAIVTAVPGAPAGRDRGAAGLRARADASAALCRGGAAARSADADRAEPAGAVAHAGRAAPRAEAAARGRGRAEALHRAGAEAARTAGRVARRRSGRRSRRRPRARRRPGCCWRRPPSSAATARPPKRWLAQDRQPAARARRAGAPRVAAGAPGPGRAGARADPPRARAQRRTTRAPSCSPRRSCCASVKRWPTPTRCWLSAANKRFADDTDLLYEQAMLAEKLDRARRDGAAAAAGDRAQARHPACLQRARLFAGRSQRAPARGQDADPEGARSWRRASRSSPTAWAGSSTAWATATRRCKCCARPTPRGPTPRSPPIWARCCGPTASATKRAASGARRAGATPPTRCCGDAGAAAGRPVKAAARCACAARFRARSRCWPAAPALQTPHADGAQVLTGRLSVRVDAEPARALQRRVRTERQPRAARSA